MSPDNFKQKNSIKELPQPKELFVIQIIFAKKISDLINISFEEALLKYTSFYKRIGILDWDYNEDNPKWIEFLNRIHSGVDPAEIAYSMYLDDFQKSNEYSKPRSCFSYNYDESEKTVSIHFRNNFANHESPLSDSNKNTRVEELTSMFKEIKSKYPEAQSVECGTWLLAYDSFKSFFPLEFTQHLEELKVGNRGMAIWGQFITSSGQINYERMEQFLTAAENSKNMHELLDAFPIKFYKALTDIKFFYEYLRIK